MTLLLLALVVVAAPEPLDPGTLARLAEVWPEVVEAAQLTSTDPLVLAAIAIGETGVRGVQGGERDEMWGAGQVRWATWAPLLLEEGIVDLEADELLEPRAGLLAAAVVLEHLRTTYHRPGALTLCLYGAGTRALRWHRDCAYSRRVLRLRDLLRGRIAGGGALAMGDAR